MILRYKFTLIRLSAWLAVSLSCVSCVRRHVCCLFGGFAGWRAPALFPQSAVLDLNPRLQDSLLVMRMKLSLSPDPLIHGQTPTASTQMIAVDPKFHILASATNSTNIQYVSRAIIAAKSETKNKSCRFGSRFVFRHF